MNQIMRLMQSSGLIVTFSLAATAPAAELSRTVVQAGSLKSLDFAEGSAHVERLQSGAEALRFDRPFNFRIDLKSKGVEPKDFDLIKLRVKADRGAVLRIAVENHPKVGDVSYWYVLDGMRGPFDWKTIWVDLTRPEEIKSRDDHRSPWRKGLGENSEGLRGVQVQGQVRDLKSMKQGPDRNIRLENVRFVREAVHLDWDQTRAPYTWGEGKDLVYTYPLTIANKLDKPVTARIHFEPVDAKHAVAGVDPKAIPLDAGQTKRVQARVTLPAAVAAKQAPLYCERFLVTAEAEGIDDSAVSVLRSSDPIHLTVTVPLDERKLKFPLFPRPSELPATVIHFDQELARTHASKDTKTLIENALQHGLYQYGYAKDTHNVGQYRQTLVSAAYLYDITGEEKYLRTAKQLLMALPDIWSKWYADYQKQPARLISSGIVARWNEQSHYTLGLGWLVMGTQRSPYYYGTSGNGRGGSMSSLAHAFDLIATHLSDKERQAIIEGFFLPVGLQARNHYIGDGNQQMTADLTAMYAGIVSRNWPLVSFGYSSEHGLLGVLEWSFDDDGVQLRKNYQTYTMRPVLWASELLHGAGHDIYPRYAKRLTQLADADTQARGQGPPFEDRGFWEFIREKRLR